MKRPPPSKSNSNYNKFWRRECSTLNIIFDFLSSWYLIFTKKPPTPPHLNLIQMKFWRRECSTLNIIFDFLSSWCLVRPPHTKFWKRECSILSLIFLKRLLSPPFKFSSNDTKFWRREYSTLNIIFDFLSSWCLVNVSS